MKSFKTLLSVFAIIGLFSTATVAQQSINATANVLSAIAYGTHADLEFGDIFSGESTSIAADSSAAGYFEITEYAQSQTIVVTDLSSTDFANAGVTAPSFTLNTTPLYLFTATPGSGTRLSLQGGGSDQIPTGTETENLYIFVGGSLDASSADPGIYNDAEISLTLEYL